MKEQRILLAEFWLPVAICLAIVALYEAEMLLPWALKADKVADYYAAIVMETVTICLIPLALWMFREKHVAQRLKTGHGDALLRWGSLRMALLTVPMMVNTFLYYQFLNVAFGYMGIIGLLCLVFIYPSRSRCEQEACLQPQFKEDER